jgi:elongation factor P
MQTVLPSGFKRGQVLMLEGAPHVIEQFHTTGTAKTKRGLHAKLRSLITGRHVARVFTEGERVPVTELGSRTVQFSYREGDTFVFLDAQTFEELDLTVEQVGERHWFLKENEEYKALFLAGKLLEVVLPDSVALKVEETAPAQRGGADGAWKSAKLEGGLEIMVPLFIGPADAIRVDTVERKYLRKETAE